MVHSDELTGPTLELARAVTALPEEQAVHIASAILCGYLKLHGGKSMDGDFSNNVHWEFSVDFGDA